MNKPKTIVCVLMIALLSVSFANNREKRHAKIKQKLKDTSHLKYNYFAPSVHIRYHHPDRKKKYLAYYNEITVKETVKHTYFCTVGFDVGYFGIQDHGRGHIAIFSVWDKGGGQNNSNAVDEADRTQVEYTNPKAKTSRFGGEGSGAKTMMPFEWELNKTYSFLVLLTPQDKGTIYTAWIAEKGKAWHKLASYRTVMTRKNINGFYSFIEDYVRNGDTGQKARLANYPDHGAMTTEGNWQRILNGSGSIADDVIQNGHSGVKDNLFYSKSGADTADYATKPKKFSVTAPESEFKLKLPADFKHK